MHLVSMPRGEDFLRRIINGGFALNFRGKSSDLVLIRVFWINMTTDSGIIVPVRY